MFRPNACWCSEMVEPCEYSGWSLSTSERLHDWFLQLGVGNARCSSLLELWNLGDLENWRRTWKWKDYPYRLSNRLYHEDHHKWCALLLLHRNRREEESPISSPEDAGLANFGKRRIFIPLVWDTSAAKRTGNSRVFREFALILLACAEEYIEAADLHCCRCTRWVPGS